MYASVIVDIAHEKVDRSFQYQIPERLEGQIRPGMVVTIPFGKGDRKISGYVIELTRTAEYDPSRMKEILDVNTTKETTESRLIALAAWMKEHYGCTMIQALKTVLPMKEKQKTKEKRKISLQVSREEALEFLGHLQKKNYKARARLLQAVLEEGELEYTKAAEQYKITASVIRSLTQEDAVLRVTSEEVYRNPLGEIDTRQEIYTLNEEQRQTVDGVLEEWKGANRPCLIRGVTGSGKTLLYMELMEQTLKEGKQVILLIPEIALTYQNVRRFYGRFGKQVSVINSKMTAAQRYDQFVRARKKEVTIMIGPRSALFTPFPDLGLIIIDEEHETSYKSETTPRYHARDTAVQRGILEHAHVVMGSATPSMEAYTRARGESYRLLTMERRFGNRRLPEVEVVDLREELKTGNRSILSESLQEGMQQSLQRGQQVMLFLNRRGYSGFVSCRSCGEVIKCPHCDVSLSAHNNGKLMCHYCGYETLQVQTCPVCGSPYMGGFKAGTQQIEQIVKKTFPQARVIRMDYDTTRKKNDYDRILSSFSKGEADVLIGTQMIVKGHDFPNVTLVGILAADVSLNSDDYRSAERTFQLLTQAVGRAGRGTQPGKAIIQTYQPEHYSIQYAVTQDYPGFYEEEMSYRSFMDYPPAGCMMAIHGSGENETQLEKGMEYLKLYLSRVCRSQQLKIIGPAWESVGKIKDIYHKVIYVKHVEYEALANAKERLEEYIRINSGYDKLYIQFDFNA